MVLLDDSVGTIVIVGGLVRAGGNVPQGATYPRKDKTATGNLSIHSKCIDMLLCMYFNTDGSYYSA